jgi:hypothetical protein
VLDVGQQQLLVLLLVGQAELDQRASSAPVEQRRHRRVDMRAPRQRLVERRARSIPARARVARALGTRSRS